MEAETGEGEGEGESDRRLTHTPIADGCGSILGLAAAGRNRSLLRSFVLHKHDSLPRTSWDRGKSCFHSSWECCCIPHAGNMAASSGAGDFHSSSTPLDLLLNAISGTGDCHYPTQDEQGDAHDAEGDIDRQTSLAGLLDSNGAPVSIQLCRAPCSCRSDRHMPSQTLSRHWRALPPPGEDRENAHFAPRLILTSGCF